MMRENDKLDARRYVLEVSKFQMNGIKGKISKKFDWYKIKNIYRVLVQWYSNLVATLIYTNDKYIDVYGRKSYRLDAICVLNFPWQRVESPWSARWSHWHVHRRTEYLRLPEFVCLNCHDIKWTFLSSVLFIGARIREWFFGLFVVFTRTFWSW